MKKTIITLASVLCIAMTGPSIAMDMDHNAKESMKKGENEHAMDNSDQLGKMIRKTVVDGYDISFRLIDMKERLKGMAGMEGMSMTHHLMVFIRNPQGHNLKDAKVGYLVKGPENSSRKAMAMGMKSGFGADMNFKEKGTYTISTKVVAGGKKLTDKFTYKVE
ncbi:MAG: hypothetical protein HN737_12000 [Desulfobacterales bacterium]|nr:hypothetical protein [Desulfobacteraceae bacterium]MBT7698119.1 hypothetical protein [Desulfobacterales bacterium]